MFNCLKLLNFLTILIISDIDLFEVLSVENDEILADWQGYNFLTDLEAKTVATMRVLKL